MDSSLESKSAELAVSGVESAVEAAALFQEFQAFEKGQGGQRKGVSAEERLSLAQATFLSQLQVSVRVDLGDLSLNAEQLIDLTPGEIFRVGFNPQEPLALRVGEECVARGVFVTENGQLALQIISVEASDCSETNQDERR